MNNSPPFKRHSVGRTYPWQVAPQQSLLPFRFNNTKFKSVNYIYNLSKFPATFNGKKPDWGYQTSYDISFEFCKALIQYFNKKKGHFDYEEFYDFLMDESHKDPEVKEIAKPYLTQFGTVEQLIFSLKNIYNQLVSFYINDKDGKKWYDDEAYCLKPIFPGYTGFLNTLNALGKDTDSLNVHTLNHDLFFERLNNTEWLGTWLVFSNRLKVEIF